MVMFPQESAVQGHGDDDLAQDVTSPGLPLSKLGHALVQATAEEDLVGVEDSPTDIHGLRAQSQIPTEQLVFFVRHAESRWNRAQEAGDLVGMYQENDHGITPEGLRQARQLAARVQLLQSATEANLTQYVSEKDKPWVRCLTNPDVIYSSPFTRAVQTALIGFKDLYRCGEETTCRPLHLMREAREHKRVGGADSTGLAVGEKEILARLREELCALFGDTEAGLNPSELDKLVDEFLTPAPVCTDLADQWWGDFSGESVSDLQDRIQAFLSRLRETRGRGNSGGGVSIVVSHLHFIQAVFMACRGSTPEERLHTEMLPLWGLVPNCGVVGTRLLWDAEGNCRIVEAAPLLGTMLTPAVMAKNANCMFCGGRSRRSEAGDGMMGSAAAVGCTVT